MKKKKIEKKRRKNMKEGREDEHHQNTEETIFHSFNVLRSHNCCYPMLKTMAPFGIIGIIINALYMCRDIEHSVFACTATATNKQQPILDSTATRRLNLKNILCQIMKQCTHSQPKSQHKKLIDYDVNDVGEGDEDKQQVSPDIESRREATLHLCFKHGGAHDLTSIRHSSMDDLIASCQIK
ncbi:hypothetical protein BLOT_001006 [Blomia tropicalis]|nr:hypothetical protein BLOT_001006 [Blomia tropicalis]